MLSTRRWALAGCVAAVLCVRAVATALVGLGDDEAYYWLWSERLALGYFDHPGGLAWLIRLTTEAVGAHPLGVRVPVLVCGGILAWLLGRTVDPEYRSFAVLLALFLPILGLLGVFSAPDMPFLVVWLATVRWAEDLSDESSHGAWLRVGAGVGATLLFKLTGVLLGLGLILWAVVDRRRRAWWGTPGPWLAVLATIIVAAPTCVWNLENGFSTVWFHAVGRHGHATSPAVGGAVWLAVHLCLLTPPVIWAMVASGSTHRGRALMWMAAPCWCVFTVAAFLTPTKLHWWAPAWVTMLPAAIPLLHARRRWALATLGAAAGLHGLVLVLAARPPEALLPLTAELRGWNELTVRLRQEYPDVEVWVANRYQTAAQLAFAVRDQPDIEIRRVGGRTDQFTVWEQDTIPASGEFLVVCAPHLPCTQADVAKLSCGSERNAPVPLMGGRALRTFQVWHCPGAQ